MKKIFTFISLILFSSIVFSQVVQLPYNTGFDSPSQTAGWQEFRKGFISSNGWSIGGGGFSGSSLSHDYNVGGNSTDTVVDWFVSPPFNFSSAGVMSLKVQTSGFSTPIPDNCEIWFGTNDPDPANGNFVLIGNLSFMQPQFQWLDTTINIPFTSDSGYIAFKYKTIGAAWMTYNIDNIQISLNPGSSVNEYFTDVNAMNIFPNPTKGSAIVSFNKNFSASEFQIKMYDSYGREVKSIEGNENAEIVLSREGLASGVYFIRLLTNNTLADSRKLIIE